MAHTPGPWVADWGSRRQAGQRDEIDRCVIATPRNERGACLRVAEINGPFFGEIDRARADALLIASAPDLLAACIDALDRLRGCTGITGLPERLRSAIAKARGEA